jgi:hypothetical protein
MRIKGKAAGALAVAGAVILTFGTPASANISVVLYGGPASSPTQWDIGNSSTCYDGSTGASALTVDEGYLYDDIGNYQDDAYDGVAAVYVGGSAYNPPSPSATSTTSVTGTTETIGNLDVTVNLTTLESSTTLRQLITLYNPGTRQVRTTVGWAGNLGSDADTQIIATGSGDNKFTARDRYLITADSTTAPGDPVSTVVFAGGGHPSVTPKRLASNCATESVNTGNDNIGVEYTVAVRPGATKYLLVFLQMSADNDTATTSVSQFNTTDSSSALFTGLDSGILPNILNWDL